MWSVVWERMSVAFEGRLMLGQNTAPDDVPTDWPLARKQPPPLGLADPFLSSARPLCLHRHPAKTILNSRHYELRSSGGLDIHVSLRANLLQSKRAIDNAGTESAHPI